MHENEIPQNFTLSRYTQCRQQVVTRSTATVVPRGVRQDGTGRREEGIDAIMQKKTNLSKTKVRFHKKWRWQCGTVALLATTGTLVPQRSAIGYYSPTNVRSTIGPNGPGA